MIPACLLQLIPKKEATPITWKSYNRGENALMTSYFGTGNAEVLLETQISCRNGTKHAISAQFDGLERKMWRFSPIHWAT